MISDKTVMLQIHLLCYAKILFADNMSILEIHLFCYANDLVNIKNNGNILFEM